MADEKNITTDGYIFFASFHESTKDLDDTKYGKLMRTVNEYAFSEIEPNFAGVLKVAFGLIKPQIDANKRKRAGYIKSVEDGKKGGAPKGNKNAAKKQPKQPPLVFENNPPNNHNGNNNVNVNENGNGSCEKQPPHFFDIKNKLTEKGFPLDDDSALESLIANTDPSWFDGHSFIDFAADVVLEEYSGKPKREQRRIFRKLLFDAVNLRDEYPQWREQREKKDAARLKTEKRERALAAIPKSCPKCGAELNNRLCCSAHGWFDFQEETLEYVFIESGKGEQNFSIMFENFRSGKKAAR